MLSGKVVGLLESRQRAELAAMVSRLGGTPVCAPSVREVPSVDGIEPLLNRLIAGHFQMVIALTGASAATLFREAEPRGQLDALRRALGHMTIACRGPKPQTVFRRQGLSATVVTPKPHTTDDLLAALEAVRLESVSVLLLQYGERSTTFGNALVAHGARVEDACLYEWALPEDIEPIRALVRQVLEGTIDALLFTTQVQFRHLMVVAGDMGVAAALVDALNEAVVVGAVGPVCAGALRAGGVVPDVQPSSPNSVSLVSALAEYFELTVNSAAE